MKFSIERTEYICKFSLFHGCPDFFKSFKKGPKFCEKESEDFGRECFVSPGGALSAYVSVQKNSENPKYHFNFIATQKYQLILYLKTRT